MCHKKFKKVFKLDFVKYSISEETSENILFSLVIFLRGGILLNINKTLKRIENNQYNIQEVLNCCCITIYQLKNSNKICNIKNFLTYLILNLENTTKLLAKFKFYYTRFDWHFTAEHIIIYSILVFYDLKNINIIEKRFLTQLKKELRLYSIFNAETRLEYLIDNKIINV